MNLPLVNGAFLCVVRFHEGFRHPLITVPLWLWLHRNSGSFVRTVKIFFDTLQNTNTHNDTKLYGNSKFKIRLACVIFIV